MRKLLVLACVFGLVGSVAFGEEEGKKEDRAIKQIDEMIAKADINKDDSGWRTRLTKPEPAAFDAEQSYFANVTTNKGPIRIKFMPRAARNAAGPPPDRSSRARCRGSAHLLPATPAPA